MPAASSGMTASSRLPPCCVVRGIADGRLALGDGRPVTLLSAPGAASFGGAATWIALVDALRDERASVPFRDILDCGDTPGRALEALRLGQRLLVFTGTSPVRMALCERAAPRGAVILGQRPEALDLSPYVRAPAEAAKRLARWLSASPAHDL